jgi:DNA-binding NtrC family response regulator
MYRVLLVDDEEMMLRALRRSLSDGLDVLTAKSGDDALSMLAKDATVAVIISDLNMPKMNGSRFLQAAKQVAPDAIQILLTGTLGFERVLGPAEDNGIFRYLTKPCRNEVIVETIKEALVEYERRRNEQRAAGAL